MFLKAGTLLTGKGVFFCLWYLVTLMSFSTTLLAQQQDEVKQAPKRLAENPVGAEQLANVTLGLIVVLGLIFALAWLYRRYGNIPTFNRSQIQVLGGVSLGSREKAVLLEVEGEKLLIGVAQGSVTKLHSFPKQSDQRSSDSQEFNEAVTESFSEQFSKEQSRQEQPS